MKVDDAPVVSAPEADSLEAAGINGLGSILTTGYRRERRRRAGWPTLFGAATLLTLPASAQDFIAGPLDPADTLVAAAYSPVAPVSPTEEQFNADVSHVEVAGIRDPAIAAALSVNDVFGVAEGDGDQSQAGRVSIEAALAEDPGRLRADVADLSIDNDLSQPTVRALMAPPGDLKPDDGVGAGPVALNAAGE